MATEAVTMPESKAPTDNGPKTEDLSVTPTFMLAKPKERGDTFSSFLNHGHPLRVDATFPKDIHKQTWQQKVSMIVVKILWRIYPLLKLVGFIFEWTLNFLVLNHGPFHILFNLLFFRWSNALLPSNSHPVLNIYVGILLVRSGVDLWRLLIAMCRQDCYSPI